MEYKWGKPDKYGDFPYLYGNSYTDEELFNEILPERLPEDYPMQLVDQLETEILAQVVNEPLIDEHLEAATRSTEPHAVPMMAGDTCMGHKYGIGFDKKGMACLIRRLMKFNPSAELIETVAEDIEDDELEECYGDTREEKVADKLHEIAYHFLSCILETLQIEYSGC